MGIFSTTPHACLLRAAIGFALVPPTEPELRLLHRWLDSWRGVGDVPSSGVRSTGTSVGR
jgi:hypothetical protein